MVSATVKETGRRRDRHRHHHLHRSKGDARHSVARTTALFQKLEISPSPKTQNTDRLPSNNCSSNTQRGDSHLNNHNNTKKKKSCLSPFPSKASAHPSRAIPLLSVRRPTTITKPTKQKQRRDLRTLVLEKQLVERILKMEGRKKRKAEEAEGPSNQSFPITHSVSPSTLRFPTLPPVDMTPQHSSSSPSSHSSTTSFHQLRPPSPPRPSPNMASTHRIGASPHRWTQILKKSSQLSNNRNFSDFSPHHRTTARTTTIFPSRLNRQQNLQLRPHPFGRALNLTKTIQKRRLKHRSSSDRSARSLSTGMAFTNATDIS